MNNLFTRLRNSAIQITKWRKKHGYVGEGYVDYMSSINLAESEMEYVDMFGLTSYQIEEYMFELEDAINEENYEKTKSMVNELHKRILYDFKKNIELWDKKFLND